MVEFQESTRPLVSTFLETQELTKITEYLGPETHKRKNAFKKRCNLSTFCRSLSWKVLCEYKCIFYISLANAQLLPLSTLTLCVTLYSTNKKGWFSLSISRDVRDCVICLSVPPPPWLLSREVVPWIPQIRKGNRTIADLRYGGKTLSVQAHSFLLP